MTTIKPIHVQQARQIADDLKELVNDDPDHANRRLKGILSDEGEAKVIYTGLRAVSGPKMWGLLPKKRRAQSEGALQGMRTLMARVQSNPAMMAQPGIQKSINMMTQLFNDFRDPGKSKSLGYLKVGHIAPHARFLLEAARNVANQATQAEETALARAEATQTEHMAGVGARKGQPSAAVDRFLDRTDGSPSALDEVGALVDIANFKTDELRRGTAKLPPLMDAVADVRFHSVELQRVSDNVQNQTDPRRLAGDQRLAKLIEEELSKHPGDVNSGSRSASYLAAKFAQALSRPTLLWNSMRKDMEDQGKKPAGERRTPEEQKKFFIGECTEIVNQIEKEIRVISVIGQALTNLSGDASLTGPQRNFLEKAGNSYTTLAESMRGKNTPYTKMIDMAKAGLQRPESTQELLEYYAGRYAEAGLNLVVPREA